MDENNMGNNNSIENNNDANGFVMVDNPAPQASQEPQEPQTENQNQNQPVQPEPEQAQQQNTNYEQPVQPSPMPSEDNTYRFQNVEAQNVKKKKEKKAKKGMSIPKILVSAVLFGVIAAGCFFGVNKGLSDLFGTKSEIQGVDNSSNNGVALTTVSGSAATVADVSGIVEKVMPSIVAITEKSTQTSYFGQTYSSEVPDLL
jgi:serine protease Do